LAKVSNKKSVRFNKKYAYIFRRNTTYYTRVKIPPDLQSRFGLTEFRLSLYTPHLTQAKHLSQAINEFIQQIYQNVRQRGKMSTLSEPQLQNIVREYVKDFIHNFELGESTGGYLNPHAYDDQLNGYDWVLDEEHDTLAERKHIKRMTPEADEVLEGMGLSLDRSSDDYHLLCYLLLKARIRSLEACKSRLEHKLQGHSVNDILKDLEIEPILEKVQIPIESQQTQTSIKFKEVIEVFWNERSSAWKPRSLIDYKSCKRNLLDYFKDIQVHELDYYKMKDYRDQLGSDRKKPLSPSRINFYLGFVRSICQFEMQTTGILNTNPVDGLRVKDTRRKDELRDVFTSEDLGELFIKSKEYGQDKHRIPENFWIPLLALYTGCRMEEMCQLYVNQVVEIDGVWCLDIDEKYPDQSVKTSEKRIIPLHPFLIDELKFHKFVKRLSPEGRLWTNLIRINSRYGHSFGKWFGDFRKRCGIDSGKKVFHSFRHTVITHLKHKDVKDQFISELVGHSVEGEKGRYGKRFNPKKLLKETVMKLDFHEKLDFSNLKSSQWVSS
jgi:integrase